MTIAEMYEACVRELAEVDAYRLRLLGRADTLRELCDAGLGQSEGAGGSSSGQATVEQQEQRAKENDEEATDEYTAE